MLMLEMEITFMTLEEVRELFPEVPKEAPQGAFGYIYYTES